MNRENKNREKKKKDPVILVLNLVIIALIFVMLYMGASLLFWKKLADEKSFTQDAGMMSFELQRGDYAGLIRGKYMNEFNGDMEAVSYFALADYVEASFLYRIYEDKGYADKADRQKAVMEGDRVLMKELTVFADKTDKMFGIGNE